MPSSIKALVSGNTEGFVRVPLNFKGDLKIPESKNIVISLIWRTRLSENFESKLITPAKSSLESNPICPYYIVAASNNAGLGIRHRWQAYCILLDKPTFSR